MKTYIEMGEKKAGKQIELARMLNVRDTALRLAKSGKKGLPDAICIKLADYIEVNPLQVIAASNLVTEKDEERRKIFKSCFTRAASIAAGALFIGGISMTSPPAHASQFASNCHAICIMLNSKNNIINNQLFENGLFGNVRAFFQRVNLAGY